MTFYHWKDFPFDRLKETVEGHLLLSKERLFELLKMSPEVKDSLIQSGGKRICVKQFCSPRLWDQLKERFRPSKGMMAWVDWNGLRERVMNSIKPMALGRERVVRSARKFSGDGSFRRRIGAGSVYSARIWNPERKERLYPGVCRMAPPFSSDESLSSGHEDMKCLRFRRRGDLGFQPSRFRGCFLG